MTINFAGVPCLLEDPSGAVASHIQKYWAIPTSPINLPPRRISPETYCQPPPWPQMPPLRLNQLYQPSGATRWSRVLLLVDEPGATALSGFSSGTLNFGLEYPFTVARSRNSSGIPSRVSSSSSSSSSATTWNIGGNFSQIMFKLDLQPVTWKGTGTGLYIVPLVDERYYWQGINLISTSRDWGTSTAALSSSSSSSSANPACTITSTLLRDISTALSANALGNPSPTNYIAGDLTPIAAPSPISYKNGPIPAAAALDLFCWSNNLMLVPDDNSNVTAVSGGTVQRYRIIGQGNATGPKSTGVWWGQEFAALNANGPQSVAGFDRYGGVGYDHPASVNMTFNSPTTLYQAQYTKNVLAPSIVVPTVGSGVMGIRCLATADSLTSSSSSSSTTLVPTNKTDLDTIATTWVNRWYIQNNVAFDWSFNKMPLLKFCGLEDYILMDMSRKGNVYAGQTLWKSLPGHFGYEYVAIETTAHQCSLPVSSSSSSGSSGSGGCGCCDCFECLSLAQATVGGCTATPNGASYQYTVNTGVTPFSDVGGTSSTTTFTYGAAVCSSSSSSSSSLPATGCIWYSCPVSICQPASSSSSSSSSAPCGVYQLTLVMTLVGGSTVETIYMNFISGTDWAGTGS